MRTLLLLLIFLTGKPSIANPLFAGFTADYEVSKNGTVLGISSRQLVSREQGKKLYYASTTVPTGFVALLVSDRFIEHSHMQVSADGIRPIQYEYQRTGGKKEMTFQARFNWHKGNVFLSTQKKTQPLSPNTQDLLSFQIAMMQGLFHGQRQFEFQIVDHKRIQLQELNYTRTDSLDSSLGKLDVLQLNQRGDNRHYRFTFWCARQLHFLPIKITKTEQDGDIVELKLKRFNKKPFHLHTQENNSGGNP